MKYSSFKKLSILGLVLIVVSAITAAVLPGSGSKSSDSNGRLQAGSDEDGGRPVTCKPGGSGNVCNITEDTITSELAVITSTSNDPLTTSFEKNTTV